MQITFDYDPETNEYTPIKQEIIKETKKSTVKKPVMDNTEPRLILESNKYILNDSALELLKVDVGDRIDIKYQLINNISFPIIGSSTAWKTETGNKLTKSYTVSYRGVANETLSKHGDQFTLTPYIGHDDLYILMGNIDREIEVDTNINVIESSEQGIDLISDDFSDNFDLVDEIENEDSFELKEFEFNFN